MNWNSTISGILERVRLHPYIPAGRERFSEIIAKPRAGAICRTRGFFYF
jgi:hypothetical protein